MNKLQQARRLIIEALWGMPYEECKHHEETIDDSYRIRSITKYKQITLCRIIKAIFNKFNKNILVENCGGKANIRINGETIDWELTKENNIECSLEDQPEGVLDAIINLFNY